MAPKKQADAADVQIEPLTLDEINRRTAEMNMQIAQTELETKTLALEDQREANARTKAARSRREMNMKQKQAELKRKTLNQQATIKTCRHKMGGMPENPLKGDGKTCLKMTRMPDGKTWLIQCGRCPLQIMSPHIALKKRNPNLYALRLAEFEQRKEEFEDYVLDPIKGVTFSFERDGLPLIPEAAYEYRGLHPEAQDAATAA